MHARNPYVAGDPVGNSPAFVGRTDVLRAVLRVLRHEQQNAIVLYGQRRIGKTSILQQLLAWLPQTGNYCPVYFDLQDKAAWPLDRVLLDLARTVAQTLGQPDPFSRHELVESWQASPETTFREEWLPCTLDNLPASTSLVLLLDEFDVVAGRGEERAVTGFFPYLRELIRSTPKRLQFVFVIGRNVHDLASIALSLFKGIPYQRVSLLSHKDTLQLIRLSEENDTLNWSIEAAERVWELTEGHPFLTQQLCSHVWEEAHDAEPEERSTVAVADVDAAVSEALDASRNTLEWLWGGLPPIERVVASALAARSRGPISQGEIENILRASGIHIALHELQSAPQLLQDWDLIKLSDDGYYFRVELLRRWICTHKPLHRVQVELDRIEPTADSLYRAALGFYRNKDLDQAAASLRQAIGLNANHVGAALLLSEILLAQGQTIEAQLSLEELYKYAPTAARPLLVEALLAEARATEDKVRELQLYARVLKIEPLESDAEVGYRNLLDAFLMRARAAHNDPERVQLYEPILQICPEQPEASGYYRDIREKHRCLQSSTSEPWNPLHLLRLLIWITARPDLLWLSWYWAKPGTKTGLRRKSNWLLSTLVLLPVLTITLALGTGRMPASQVLSSSGYLLMSGGLIIAWLLNGWLGRKNFGALLVMAGVAAYFIGTNVEINMYGGLVLIVVFYVTFNLASGVTFGTITSLAEGASDLHETEQSAWDPSTPGSWPAAVHPEASLEPFLAGGITGIVVGFLLASYLSVLWGLATGVLAFLASFGLVFASAVAVGESLRMGRPSRLLLLGVLSSLGFYILLIWFCLLSGWRVFAVQ